MTTFTKGPWTCDQVATSIGRAFRIGTGEMLEAGKGCCIIYDDYPSGVKSHEREANAHLISASPELLEALEAMVNLWVRLADSGDAGFWDPEEDEEIIQARAALAKARGVKEG